MKTSQQFWRTQYCSLTQVSTFSNSTVFPGTEYLSRSPPRYSLMFAGKEINSSVKKHKAIKRGFTPEPKRNEEKQNVINSSDAVV